MKKATSQIKKRVRYALTKSPFFNLQSKKALAAVLELTLAEVSMLVANGSKNYRFFDDPDSGRHITEPLGKLKIVHKRIAKLFSRIEPPKYLQSATKGRSYKTNAFRHIDAGKVVKLDVEKFYNSIPFGIIFRFFREKLRCSLDVSTILAKLCSVLTKGRTHLPTGSSLSPLLSFWVCEHVFQEIEKLCTDRGCVMSLYVDDITVSGVNADSSLVQTIVEKLTASGFVAHKIAVVENKPVTITGVIAFKKKLFLPHSRAKKIRELKTALSLATPETEEKLLSGLIGRLNEAEQFVSAYGVTKTQLLIQHKAVWGKITAKRVMKSRRAIAAKRKTVMMPVSVV